MATQVLGQIDLNGTIVTADALHTVKATWTGSPQVMMQIGVHGSK
jgi:hypothetical protein